MKAWPLLLCMIIRPLSSAGPLYLLGLRPCHTPLLSLARKQGKNHALVFLLDRSEVGEILLMIVSLAHFLVLAL
jgi:hypothetical protein